MSHVLTWQEIEARYFGEWIQLVEYEWPEGYPHPVRGAVRLHASDRVDFFAHATLYSLSASPSDAVVLLVGKPTKLPKLELEEAALSTAEAAQLLN